MKHVLVVEDELDIQELLQNFLEADDYKVTLASDGIEAMTRFKSDTYDLILLDIMLPKIDGYGVCELIRQESSVPIVMLTALASEDAQVKGFDLYVDDYITKPFSMTILLKKIAAILRRTDGNIAHSNNQIAYRGLLLDLDGYLAYINEAVIDLTQREFEVLRELLTHQGKVVTRQLLLSNLWEYDFYGDERVVDTHIKNIRKKLAIDWIETIRGVGYRVNKET